MELNGNPAVQKVWEKFMTMMRRMAVVAAALLLTAHITPAAGSDYARVVANAGTGSDPLVVEVGDVHLTVIVPEPADPRCPRFTGEQGCPAPVLQISVTRTGSQEPFPPVTFSDVHVNKIVDHRTSGGDGVQGPYVIASQPAFNLAIERIAKIVQ